MYKGWEKACLWRGFCALFGCGAVKRRLQQVFSEKNSAIFTRLVIDRQVNFVYNKRRSAREMRRNMSKESLTRKEEDMTHGYHFKI